MRCSDKAFSYNLLEMIKTISLKCKENSTLEKYLRKNSFLVRLWGFSLCASLLIFCVQLGRKGRKRKFKTKSKLVNGMQDSRYILKCFLIVQWFLDFFYWSYHTHLQTTLNLRRYISNYTHTKTKSPALYKRDVT